MTAEPPPHQTEPGRALSARPARRPPPASSIVDLILFEARTDRPWRRAALATALVSLVYGILALLVLDTKSRRATLAIDVDAALRAATVASPIAEPIKDQLVELGPPPPRSSVLSRPAPLPPPRSPWRAREPPAAAARREARGADTPPSDTPTPPTQAPAAPVAPAQAAPVIVRAPSPAPAAAPDAPEIVSGNARSFAGGASAAGGTSAVAVHGAIDIHAVPTPGPGTGVGAGDPSGGARPSHRARPVTLADDTWHCPWPAQAEAEPIDEQVVIIRVWVRDDGSVEQAQALSDPGLGFGPAALACARQTIFQAARDARGAPTAAWSPPIRVHFLR